MSGFLRYFTTIIKSKNMLVEIIKKRLTFFWLLIYLGFIIWIASFLSIPKEENPSVDLPMFVVNTVNIWGNPETIEKQITNTLEDEIKSISGIKKIESVSNFNYSTIIATFNDNKDITEAKWDLKDVIDEVSIQFPANTSNSVVKQISPSDTPIYSFWVSADATSKTIYDVAESLEDDIKSLEWVSEIIVTGEPSEKISVYLDYEKINQFWVNISQVYNVLSNVFVNQPVDKKDIWGNLYSYEILTFSKNKEALLEQLNNTDIVNIDSRSIKLSDIAEVYFEEKSERQKSYIMWDWEVLNTVSFDIKVTPGADIEQIIENVKRSIDEWKTDHTQMQVYETYSKSKDIDNMYGTFVSNFRQTGLTIMVILFLFIWVRISLWVTIAFPLVYFITFILLSFLGYSFNSVVSFALVLTLGIMVDNLIVITEWIVWEFNLHKNITFWDATSNAIKKYMWSIIPGTLITVFMFLPILFMVSGTVGAFIWPLSITIWFTLITSLVVSIFMLPIILSKVLPENVDKAEWILTKPLQKVWVKISHFTKKLIKNKTRAFLTIILFWVALIFSFVLVGSGVVKNDFLPQTDKDNIFINVKYPLGYSLDKNAQSTSAILTDIREYLDKKYPDYVEFVYINVWNVYSSSAIGSASNPTADYQAYFNIKLIDGDDREISSIEISEGLQEYINQHIKPKYPYVKDISNVVVGGMWWGKEIWFFIVWDDIEKISDYLDQIKPEIEAIDGIYNFSSNYEFTNGKVSYVLDPNKLNRNDINLGSIAQLFTSIENSKYVPNGLTLHNFTELWDDTIALKLYTSYQGNVEDVKIWDTFVSSVTQERTLEPELKNIQHIDGKMQLSFEADKKASVALGWVTAEINKVIENNPLPKGLAFRFNSNIEDSAGSGADLWAAMWVGLILMFIILVLKFNSFKYSIIIVTSTFLSFIWVVLALMLMGLPLSFPAQLWLFGVIWVWVNNAILFIDWYLGKVWFTLKQSLIETIQSRFLPIFLTSSTTIAGLVTLALKDELWGWLAIAFIGWLILNVFMILVYIPALLYVVEKKK